MKVAFLHLLPLSVWTRTGDRTVLAKTVDALKKAGGKVEMLNVWQSDQHYDVLHLFAYTHALAGYAEVARGLGMKVVVTPIATSMGGAWRWRIWRVFDKMLPIATTYTNLRRLFLFAHVVLPASNTELRFLQQAFGVS